MQTTKQLQRFYVVEVFRPQPPIPGSQGSETVSLPCGTSAFDQRQYTTRVDRARVEGTSPSTCARSRFPLHPSLSALDGVSIEGKRWSIHRGKKMKHLDGTTSRLAFLAIVLLSAGALAFPINTKQTKASQDKNVEAAKRFVGTWK